MTEKISKTAQSSSGKIRAAKSDRVLEYYPVLKSNGAWTTRTRWVIDPTVREVLSKLTK